MFTVHGTTIATNTIIEGKGAKAGLITSEGFRDVLEIAYQTRPKLYDIFYDKAKPLIPRYLCQGVPERIDGDGVVLVPLDEDAVRAGRAQARRRMASKRSRSRFSIPTRIRRTSGAAARFSPKNCRTCRSSCPPTSARNTASTRAHRRRSSTRCCSRASDPTSRGFEERLEERGDPLRPAFDELVRRHHRGQRRQAASSASRSNRGRRRASSARRSSRSCPATRICSPSTSAARRQRRRWSTTAQPQIADQFEVGSSAVATVTAQRGQGYPVLTPVISLVEIGAGGGSIAHVDPGGVLTVGPQSAGAVPGPACYGRGGTAADADRRESGARPPQSRLFPRRRDQARTSTSRARPFSSAPRSPPASS